MLPTAEHVNYITLNNNNNSNNKIVLYISIYTVNWLKLKFS